MDKTKEGKEGNELVLTFGDDILIVPCIFTGKKRKGIGSVFIFKRNKEENGRIDSIAAIDFLSMDVLNSLIDSLRTIKGDLG
jgi:hypothetical protein